MCSNTETGPPGRLRAGITFNLKKNIPSELPKHSAETEGSPPEHSAETEGRGSPPDAEAEFDDEETIRAIQNALMAAGLAVELFEATEELPVRLLRERPDIVFNIAEGMTGRGREAQVPAILNFLRIPFTGSDETTMCIAMDKALTKRLVTSYGVNTPDYEVVKYGAALPETALSFPVIVKPNSEGSSKGITDLSIVKDAAALRRILPEKFSAYKQDMLLEEYIGGREFSVGILGSGDELSTGAQGEVSGDLRVFPPMEIIFTDKDHSIYSYEVKKNFRRYVRYECPPDIDAALRREIEETAEKIYRSLECRDFARVDFRLSSDSKLYFIEINPLPGLAPEYSDFPMIARFCGMDYQTLIWNILDSALARYGMRSSGKVRI